MSEQGNLQFVWDIMQQSEWWKQYSEMVSHSAAECYDCGSSGYLGSEQGSWTGSWVFSSWQGSSWSSGAAFWPGSWTGAELQAWWSSSSGAWWMEIPEGWWSSFAGSEWEFSSGSGLPGSAGGLGYGLSLI